MYYWTKIVVFYVQCVGSFSFKKHVFDLAACFITLTVNVTGQWCMLAQFEFSLSVWFLSDCNMWSNPPSTASVQPSFVQKNLHECPFPCCLQQCLMDCTLIFQSHFLLLCCCNAMPVTFCAGSILFKILDYKLALTQWSQNKPILSLPFQMPLNEKVSNCTLSILIITN